MPLLSQRIEKNWIFVISDSRCNSEMKPERPFNGSLEAFNPAQNWNF